MTITDALLTMGASHGRPGRSLVPQGVVVHYVGNAGSSAMGNRNYFESGSAGAQVSSHFIIGLNGEILRCVPENEVAYHAGIANGPQWSEMAKTNNFRFIGIECCHPSADGKFNAYTIASLTWLAADLCRRFKLDPTKDVYRHYDVGGKVCPLYYVRTPDAWIALKNQINALYKQMIGAQTTAAPAAAPATASPAPAAPAPATAAPAAAAATAPAAKAAPHAPSGWAADAWAWAAQNGMNDGTRPQDNATREEVASILYKFYQHIAKSPAAAHEAPKPAAPSAGAPSAWAADAWAWAKKSGLNDGTRPHDVTTREETASALYRFYLLIAKAI